MIWLVAIVALVLYGRRTRRIVRGMRELRSDLQLLARWLDKH